MDAAQVKTREIHFDCKIGVTVPENIPDEEVLQRLEDAVTGGITLERDGVEVRWVAPAETVAP